MSSEPVIIVTMTPNRLIEVISLMQDPLQPEGRAALPLTLHIDSFLYSMHSHQSSVRKP